MQEPHQLLISIISHAYVLAYRGGLQPLPTKPDLNTWSCTGFDTPPPKGGVNGYTLYLLVVHSREGGE